MTVQESPEPTDGDTTSVYKYYDASDKLLYVGITRRGINRQHEHNERARWWQYVRRQDVEHWPTRREALDRERKLIENLRPPFNKQYNPQGDLLSAVYEFTATAEPVPDENPQPYYSQIGRRLMLQRAGDLSNRLITAAEDFPVARYLQMEKKVPVVVPGIKTVGNVTGIYQLGDRVIITVGKRVPPLRWAIAHLRMVSPRVPYAITIRSVYVIPERAA